MRFGRTDLSVGKGDHSDWEGEFVLEHGFKQLSHITKSMLKVPQARSAFCHTISPTMVFISFTILSIGLKKMKS